MNAHARPNPVRSRIGADQARWWVRQINLRNPYAKSILMAVANYMNEDGAAWPGLATLAQDTDISEDTIASRLRWCEQVGVIVLLKCWVDENGRRNYEKRGRPTSSEIRFLFDADLAGVEAAAKDAKGDTQLRGAAARAHASRGEGDDATPAASDSEDSEFCHRSGRVPAEDAQRPVSPGVAPEQPPPGAVRSLESELEDSPPNPPPGGVRSELDQLLDRWIAELVEVYPIPISDVPRTRALGTAMTERERADVLLGAKGYRGFIDAERKRTSGKGRSVKDAHRWIKDGGHQGYLVAGREVESRALRFDAAEGSEQWKAWQIYYQLCGSIGIPAYLITGASSQRMANMPSEWPPVGHEIDPDKSKWRHKAVQYSDQRGASFAAWMRKLRSGNFEITISTKSEFIDGEHRATLMMPSPFPPSLKDGTISTGPPTSA